MASTRVIGLDIGATGVRAAQLEFGSGSRTGKAPPTLARYGQVALPPGAVRDGEVTNPEPVAEALKQLWSEQKFETKDVVIGVGNQRVVVRELDLPWMPASQIRAALPFQVAELLPMSVDEALLDFYPTSENETGDGGRVLHGMLVAAQRETVVANVLAVESAGLHPTMVDLNAFALVRALSRGDTAGQVVAFVDVGASVTTVMIADHGVPRLVRSLPVAGAQITGAVANALNCSHHEAEQLKRQIGIGSGSDNRAAEEAIQSVTRGLVEAVRNTFVYYAGNNPGAGLQTVILTGGGAHLIGLGQYMSSSSRLPVLLGDALTPLRLGKQVDPRSVEGTGSLLAMPVGLAYGVAA